MPETLLMIIYILLIGFLIVAILIGIKLLGTLGKVNEILDDVHEKISSLDKIFEIVSIAGDRMAAVTEGAFGFLTSITSKLFGKSKKRKKRAKIEEEDEEDE